MREIKFRAWNPKGYWSSDWSLSEYSEILDLAKENYPYDHLVLEQYTGLKDKNGREIYEGDVIAHRKRSRPYSSSATGCTVHSVVEWKNGDDKGSNLHRPGFVTREIYNEKGYGCYDWCEFLNCEVIGNIHENPELLKAEGS